MFSNQYEQERLAVIDIFNQYVKNRDELRNNFNLSDGLDDVGMAMVQREVEKLRENKYILAIVGESKSGKSTFINALLGKSVLPTGILQCTSGITEIADTDNDRDSSKVYLKVKYGHSEEPRLEFEGRLGEDITPLREKLKAIAALKQEYRDLPIFQLNQFLIEKKPVQITSGLVKEECGNLLKDENNNPYKLPKEEFEELVWKYLADYRDLSKIPVDISIGYPVGLKFAHIQIVDTPGVNARGGLETATLNYINNANAVIFIHPLKNIASGSLGKFFKKVPGRSYKSIFMCLTHKAQHTAKDVELTVAETKKLFPEIKPEERIVAVDSMLKLIHDELKMGTSLGDLMNKDEEKRKLLADYYWRHKDDVTKFREAVLTDVLTDSNFTTVQDLLSTFSEYALIGQLEDIIKSVAGGYEEQQKVYDNQIRLIGWKAEFAKTPEQFDQEINKLKALLDDYQLRLNDFSQQKRSEGYKGRHSTVNKTFSTMKAVYDKLLGNADNEDQIRKHIVDFNDECDREVTRFTTQLHNEYEAEMDRVGAEFKAEHQISPPKINLVSISEEAKKQAYKVVTIPGDLEERIMSGIAAGAVFGALIGLGALAGGPVGAVIGAKAAAIVIGATATIGGAAGGVEGYFEGTPTKKESQFDDQQYKATFISEAKNLVNSITDSMPQAISDLFDSYNGQFKEKLGNIIKERQNVYEQLKKDQEDAKKLGQLKSGKKMVTGVLEKINNLTTQLSSSTYQS